MQVKELHIRCGAEVQRLWLSFWILEDGIVATVFTRMLIASCARFVSQCERD